jgi:hypothetical protein
MTGQSKTKIILELLNKILKQKRIVRAREIRDLGIHSQYIK